MRFILAVLLCVFGGHAFAQTSSSSSSITSGQTPVVNCTNGYFVYNNNGVAGCSAGTGSSSNLTVGTSTITSGTSGRILYDNAGVLGELATTGSGNVVLATSPTLTTPALGTPSSVTLTNATGLPISTGVSGLGTGVATSLGDAVNTAGGILTYGTTLPAAMFPALTGDVTTTAGALGTTLATVNSNIGSFGSATQAPQFTVNGKGLITAAANVTVTPAVGSITGLGTGVGTALANALNASSGLVGFSGALGTPTSGTLTNATGLPVGGIASIGANTVVGNGTSLSASPTALSVPSCSAAASALTWTSGTGFGCNMITSSVTSVSNSDGTLTISPTSGAVVASLALGHANTWTAAQTLNGTAPQIILGANSGNIGELQLNGSTSGALLIVPQATAGTPTWTAGTSSGTPAVTASSPLAITTLTGNITCATCVTSSGGGAITGTAPVAVSAAGAVSITGAAGQVLAGASPAFTATPTLGASGTVGTIAFGNATSGTVTLGTVTGALGSVTASLPANTGTLAELNLAQTWTAVQTFTNSDIALLGSGAGATTFTSDNSSATNYTIHVPAANDTIALIAASQILTNKTISGSSNTLSNIALSSLASQAANTLVANSTGSSASPTAVSVSSTVWTPFNTATNSSGGMALVNGTPSAGNCLKWSATGVQDAGSPCGGSGTGASGPYTVGTAITATGTVASLNKTYCVNPAAAVTLTLPASPTTGDRVVLKDCTGAMTPTVTATIQSNATPASYNIDAQATFIMNTAYQENAFWFNGTIWSAE